LTYQFQYSDYKFSIGGLDEKLAYDRYSTPEHDISKIHIGDTVVCKLDRKTDKRVIGELLDKFDIDNVRIRTRTLLDDGVHYEDKIFHHELICKPLDINPVDFWTRWAKAGASVENENMKDKVEDDFRWMFDGYRVSSGGRIQLMAGQEFVNGKKAQLSAFNCFVIPSPVCDIVDWHVASLDKSKAKEVISAIIDNAVNEAQIMARGGGVGYNASTIPPKIIGAGSSKDDVVLYLPETHPDIDILRDLVKLGKFDHVTISTTKEGYDNYLKLEAEDSREGLLSGSKWMARKIYEGNKVFVDFSKIRYKGSLVKGVNGRSSGAPSWMVFYDVISELLHMKFYDCVDTMEIQSYITSLIEQGGSRRGALMIVLNDNHPNIRKFITRKETVGKITGANVSVGVSNKFMKTLKEAKSNNNSTEHVETLKTWEMIVESAWKSAEPGIIFMEYYNDESNSWYFAPIIATNPCGKVLASC
jgi:ribonucleotide reductase alpha subunit